MKCFKCTKKAAVSLRHIGQLCSGCFLRLIEKRVRKGLRTNKLISKNDNILFIDNKSKEFQVGYFLLKNIIKGLPVKIKTKKSKKINIQQTTSKKYNKIIIPWSLDDEAEEFLNTIFNKKSPQKFNKKTIKLLKNLSEEEIESFAKIKRFKYTKNKRSKIKRMLDKLEQRYPGYKFSLLRSISNVQNL